MAGRFRRFVDSVSRGIQRAFGGVQPRPPEAPPIEEPIYFPPEEPPYEEPPDYGGGYDLPPEEDIGGPGWEPELTLYGFGFQPVGSMTKDQWLHEIASIDGPTAMATYGQDNIDLMHQLDSVYKQTVGVGLSKQDWKDFRDEYAANFGRVH